MSAFNNFLFKNHFLSLFLIILVIFSSQVSVAQSPYLLINSLLSDNIEMFDNLIEAGMDADARYNDDDLTALMNAAWMGRLEALKILLEAGADPRLRGGFYEKTTLMFAARAGHLDIVEVLLKTREGIESIDSQDSMGRTAFMHAVGWGRWDVAEALLEAGANPDLPDVNDMTILMSSAWEGRLGAVIFLANHTAADLDLQGRGNLTALMWAAWAGHFYVVNALVEAGASLKVQNNGSTAFDYAVAAGHATVANYLMDAGEGGVRGWFCRHLAFRCYKY